jgi:hypothetical protein
MQRPLTVGLAAAAWLPVEALAEICDKGKGGDSWTEAHGPVWLLNPVGWPLGMIGLLLWLVLAARGPKWIGYSGAALLAAWLAVGVIDLVEQHAVYRMQVAEGCRTLATDWADMGLLALFAIAYGWLGFRRHRAEAADVMRRV